MNQYRLQGRIRVPGDKSISHRAAMLSSIAEGRSYINDYSTAIDCRNTLECLLMMGLNAQYKDNTLFISGSGMRGLIEPDSILQCGDSGTTMRLLAGILAGQDFSATLDGDAALRKRPMQRIITPLNMMGANVTSADERGYAPIHVQGGNLKAINYTLPMASAQVKSAVLLAGLYADGSTVVTEPAPTRNHTEVILKNAGAEIYTEGNSVMIHHTDRLYPFELDVPGDFSCASYFIAGTFMLPGSDVVIENVGLNSTRTGMLRILERMGAKIDLDDVHWNGGEMYGDIHVRYQPLHAVTIEGQIVPSMIDELPVLAALACSIEGTTVIHDAAELRFKESNRIDLMVKAINALGGHAEPLDDGMIIEGNQHLTGGTVETNGDHRIAMASAMMALTIDEDVFIKQKECAAISYPTFYQDLSSLLSR